MAGDLSGDITRHFDGTADTASLNAGHRLEMCVMRTDPFMEKARQRLNNWANVDT